MAALYGLTPAEARVFAQLAGGRAPVEAARALGVAPSPFHSHLLRVYDNLGVHRQAELVRLAAALASPMIDAPADGSRRARGGTGRRSRGCLQSRATGVRGTGLGEGVGADDRAGSTEPQQTGAGDEGVRHTWSCR